jgi:NitT/TauT family transport system ATP-binding protein
VTLLPGTLRTASCPAPPRKTVIFVTHNITEAILLADRVVAMTPRPGRIARVVDIDLERPRIIAMEFSERFKTYSEEVREVIYQGRGTANDG